MPDPYQQSSARNLPPDSESSESDLPISSAESSEKKDTRKRSFFERISDKFFHSDEPETTEELLDEIHVAHDKRLLTDDAMLMIEGVLRVASLRADDLMVPRGQMIVIDIAEDAKTWVNQVIAAGHSRFPVIDGDKDNIIGILLAKDLLKLFVDPKYRIREHLRAPVYVPESKPADILLKEFRLKRNHMALVVDEFGSISGLITIEDVLEEIVGEIDDEYDIDQSASNIVAIGPDAWRVKAGTQIDDFNRYFGTHFSDDRYESVGGLLSDEFEHVPRAGESIDLEGFRFKVTKALARQVQILTVEKLPSDRTSVGEDGPGNATQSK